MDRTKILIVEDEGLIALQLSMMLGRAGFEVCEPVGLGEDAIEHSREERPDVILMDIRLRGEMDGIEAARQIGGFSRAKIIFTTGHADPETRARAEALRPAAFLVKPVAIRSIETAIAGDAAQSI
jgi:CheY-like chemotaxis protein